MRIEPPFRSVVFFLPLFPLCPQSQIPLCGESVRPPLHFLFCRSGGRSGPQLPFPHAEPRFGAAPRSLSPRRASFCRPGVRCTLPVKCSLAISRGIFGAPRAPAAELPRHLQPGLGSADQPRCRRERKDGPRARSARLNLLFSPRGSAEPRPRRSLPRRPPLRSAPGRRRNKGRRAERSLPVPGRGAEAGRPPPPRSRSRPPAHTKAAAAGRARDRSPRQGSGAASRLGFSILMNIQRSTPITIARYGRPRNKTQDFEELSSIRSIEPSQSFSPNLGSPSPPETPNLSHCVSCIGKYLLLEPLEGDHVFRAVHLHSGEELVCKVMPHLLVILTSRVSFPCLAGGPSAAVGFNY